jgi:protoporphyrinogen oxidase
VKVGVFGAGPAGLTAADLLTQQGVACAVFERDAQPGGLSKTICYKGFRFDIGGHRFFTRVPWIERYWQEALGADFLKVRRLSRIHHKGQLFLYPLRVFDALPRLGLGRSLKVLASYLRARAAPLADESTLDRYIINRFGRKLFETFFRTYTEKVWGTPCEQISSEWARQRIGGLSLPSAVWPGHYENGRRPKTLIEEFRYPKYGPGMLWDAVRERIQTRGNRVHLEASLGRLRHEGGRVTEAECTLDGGTHRVIADHYLSSVPLRELTGILDPPPPQPVLDAARRLRYRDFIAINLCLRQPSTTFPDQWIYVHSDRLRVARIQNYGNWSSALLPEAGWTALGMEYFCSEQEDLWRQSDADLLALAARELQATGLAEGAVVADGCVVRVAQAYPVYDTRYRAALDVLREYLRGFANFQTIGRNGCHRYNNQDQSMVCARLAVENIFGAGHDVWSAQA